MTERLYYHDSHLLEFSARVNRIHARPEGLAVLLNRTAFYPTGGGQPHDTGLLGDSPVFDVMEDEGSGEILHLVAPGTALAAGDTVECAVNYRRRFDHLQQHTGQHILSRAFLEVARAATVGFHMGEESSTIDLEWAAPDGALMDRAEDLANQIIFENRPIRGYEVDADQQQSLELRKISNREGRLRIIEVEGFDRTPCGGTHGRHSGEVGIVLLRGWEKMRGNCRIEFVCGGRASREYRSIRGLVEDATRQLSIGRAELPRKISQMLEEGRAQRRRIQELGALAVRAEAADLAAAVPGPGGVRMAVAGFSGRSVDELKSLAKELNARGVSALLASRDPDGFRLVFSAPREGPVIPDMLNILNATVHKFGGRGGGRREFAQGMLPPEADPDRVLDFAREVAVRQSSQE